MTNHRPYKGINELPDRPGLRHAIIGLVLFAIVFFGTLFLWAIFTPDPPPVNDRAPALERMGNDTHKMPGLPKMAGTDI